MSAAFDNKQTSDISIRLANATDAAALAELRYALRSRMPDKNEGEEHFIERCIPWMEARLTDGGSWRCWLAEQDSSLVGALWLQLIEKIPNPNSESEYFAYVTNFYVREGARGKGIGSCLLSTALDWCKAFGVYAVILWPTVRSRSLYERHGFAAPSDLIELLIADKTTMH
jgi:GNAT superfamily N-acetyltransferase